MQQLSKKQTRIIGIVAAVLLTVHFLPTILRTVVLAFTSRHAAIVPPPRQPIRLPEPAPAAAKPPSVSPDIQAKYLGTWQGSLFLPNNDQCRISLELRLDPVLPGSVAGYETKSCFNIPAYVGEKNHVFNLADAMRQASPVSTVLSGFPADGDIDFAVKKIIGSSPFQCPHASYSASSFGQKSIVAQWRDIDCPAGQVVLTRAGG
jgi:hypothetical protein